RRHNQQVGAHAGGEAAEVLESGDQRWIQARSADRPVERDRVIGANRGGGVLVWVAPRNSGGDARPRIRLLNGSVRTERYERAAVEDAAQRERVAGARAPTGAHLGSIADQVARL